MEEKNTAEKFANEFGKVCCEPFEFKPNWDNGKPKSELEVLLEKNAYTADGLTAQEKAHVRELILNPVYSDEDCWACSDTIHKGAKSIYDTKICQGHAFYAFATRK